MTRGLDLSFQVMLFFGEFMGSAQGSNLCQKDHPDDTENACLPHIHDRLQENPACCKESSANKGGDSKSKHITSSVLQNLFLVDT